MFRNILSLVAPIAPELRTAFLNRTAIDRNLKPTEMNSSYITYGMIILGGLCATSVYSKNQSLMPGQNGYSTTPLFTVGETIHGYSPPGILDGLAAFDRGDHIYLLANHEMAVNPPPSGGHVLPNGEYSLENGVSLSGGRISFFQIDKGTRTVTDAGLAFDRIINRAGEEVDEPADLVFKGVDRLCSAFGTEAGRYGFVDTIFLAGEETTDETDPNNPIGGGMFALDVEGRSLWAAPALGVAKWENAVPLNVPAINETHIILLLGDDTDGAPLYLYVGEKDRSADAGFLSRNGLAQGELYMWKTDDGSTLPKDFAGNGNSKSGRFVQVVNYQPESAGQDGFDALGYAALKNLHSQRDLHQAFRFSRPEDLATNPDNGTQLVFASTGHTFDSADFWGTTYIIDVEITKQRLDSGSIGATIRVLHDGDAFSDYGYSDSREGLRNPDNLCWATDGFIYVQEDRATYANRDSFGQEGSIWRLDPNSGAAVRVAQMDRTAIPSGQVDASGVYPGLWESSGIIDVSGLFEERPGTLFLFTVQAHYLRGSVISSKGLAEGGQLLFLSRDPDPATTDHDQDGLSALLEDLLGTSDEDSNSGLNQLRIDRKSEGQIIVSLKHRRLVDRALFHLECSSDLLEWQDAKSFFEEIESGTNETAAWGRRSQVETIESMMKFVRVRVDAE